MTGQKRRVDIIQTIQASTKPISGHILAKKYDISRQVIVQDIALLRAEGYDIISTNKGYVVNSIKKVSRIFKVQHTDEQMEDELCSIVDLGGCVENVVIHHKVYGTMEATLSINSRRKVQLFMEDIRIGKSSPLKNITSNYHYHKVTADSEEILDIIEGMLKEKQYLIEKE
ncbi:MAG: transcription repressor NadR [Lachnospiraceae bacterium]|nr:transcription repressor NadR [Lachnospiraceae bacterium]